MAIGRSQMTKQVDGQLRGARKIKKVAKGLAKASRTHAKQSKILKGILGGSKKRNRKKA
tara:strand:+ start:2509 stop:2685 length:177 start_codon:yes stop_codon:yes gene_type:complete